MPVRRVSIGGAVKVDDAKRDLKSRLIGEWSGKGSIEPRPTICEEADEKNIVVHVYVVWDAWRDLDHNARSEVITEAFWELFGEKGLALTVAMGLTSEEADRMKLQYE